MITRTWFEFKGVGENRPLFIDFARIAGTLGKIAVGIIVTDTNGNRITWLRALGRYFAKILSGIVLLIGHIMVAFTERKQGLHDMICSTLVVKGRPGEGSVDPTVFD
ncbi:MAG: hypothetical protein EBS78_06045 [Altererythrobacter sp.]|nr:hypothetical protein [Altererythrobacter sp.]